MKRTSIAKNRKLALINILRTNPYLKFTRTALKYAEELIKQDIATNEDCEYELVRIPKEYKKKYYNDINEMYINLNGIITQRFTNALEYAKQLIEMETLSGEL